MNREKITTRIRPLLASAAFSLLLVSGGMAPAFAETPADTPRRCSCAARSSMPSEKMFRRPRSK